MKNLFIFLVMFSGFENIHPQTTSITLPGADITSMAVFEKANKLFIADDDNECIYVIDGSANIVEDTILSVGGAIFYMVVNETTEKLFAASSIEFTTGINSGLGLISVIDANTYQIITQINPGYQGNASYFCLSNDEVHDKIYVRCQEGYSVIDATTNISTKILGTSNVNLTKFGINTITNEIFAPTLMDGILIINGTTLETELIPYPVNADHAIDVEINEAQNKVYITMVGIPDQPEMGICIYDRSLDTFYFRGADDLEPLAFNQLTGKLFSGVQVGQNGAIVEGINNDLTYVNLSPGDIRDVKIKYSTDRAYLSSTAYTWIIDGAQKFVAKKIASGLTFNGGLAYSGICINQNTGQVYVVNIGRYGIINVFTDFPTPEQAGIISGNSSVCQGQNNVIYTVPVIKDASSYIWTLPSGATGSSTTNSISVNYNNSAHSGNISVKGSNDGGEGKESTLAVTLNATPYITVKTDGSHCGMGTIVLGAESSEGIINWYTASTGGSSIGTGTSFTTPNLSATTTYYVDATNDGCTTAERTAVTATILNNDTCLTPIPGFLSSGRIKIYPNPTTGKLEISLNNFTGKIELFNNIGSLLKTISIEKNENSIHLDLSLFPSGVYFLRFNSGTGIYRFKIMKE